MHLALHPLGQLEAEVLTKADGHLRRWHTLPVFDMVFEDEDERAAGTQRLVGVFVDRLHGAPVPFSAPGADLVGAAAVIE